MQAETLVGQPCGRRIGAHQLLGEAEHQSIRQAVLDHRPCDLGLAGQLWTRAGVRDLITKLHQVRLTDQGVGKHLRRWRLSFQRPDKRAVEQERGSGARLAGGDLADDPGQGEGRGSRGAVRRPGRHPLRPGHRPRLGRQGVHPGSPPHLQPFPVNAISAINTKGRMHFLVFTEAFDADVMCRFLDRRAGHFDMCN